jgi:hypothetical protein
MGLRQALRRLEKSAEGHLESFKTKDGRTYVYGAQEVGIELFLYTCALIRSSYDPDQPPEEPPFLEAVRNAADPDEVISRFEGGDRSKKFVDVRLLVYGPEDARSLYEADLPDLSD